MKTYYEFATHEEARAYRREIGKCGGWIFAAEDGRAFLFPLPMTVGAVMLHPLTHGLNGMLI